MAFKSVALPLLSGAALMVGYLAVTRLRGPRRPKQYSDRPLGVETEPLSQRLEHVPEELALDADSVPDCDVDAPQFNEHASEYASEIRALFIARVTEALDPFANPSARYALSQRGVPPSQRSEPPLSSVQATNGGPAPASPLKLVSR